MLEISSGVTSTMVLVGSGATLVVDSGGTAIQTLISGGYENVAPGGLDLSATVSNGLQVVDGTVVSATILNGGDQYIRTGATATASVVDGGGSLFVYAAAMATSTTINGGWELIDAGGVDVGATVNAGTQSVFGSARAATIVGAGEQTVYSGGAVSGSVIASGGTQFVYAGGSATGDTVGTGGYENVASGGTDIDATVSSGGLQVVDGAAVSATIESGASQYVRTGATAGATIVETGANLFVYSSASVIDARVNGGWELINAGGTDLRATVSSGLQSVFGTVSSATLVSSTQVIYGGGTAIDDELDSGTYENVAPGGTDIGATVIGAKQVVDGAAISATIENGGNQYIRTSATASATVVDSGGNLFVYSGATATGTTIASGGLAYVAGGGLASGSVISGGTLEIAAGGSVGSSGVSFADGAAGTLQLDGAESFTGLVAGFGKPDALDLRDIAFGSSTSLSWTQVDAHSGTLTVTDGVNTANITLLGHHMATQFVAASDNHGGTVVTDPPGAVAANHGVGNPHNT
jgi:autotransporter passenger strand-loop-strand repeat protein